MRINCSVMKLVAGALALVSLGAHAALPRFKVEPFGDYAIYGALGAADINNLGQVVGQASFGGDTPYGFIYQAGRLQKLEQLGPGAAVFSINDRGEMGGQIEVNGFPTPMIYVDEQIITFGSALGPGIGNIKIINEAGHAVGEYFSFSDNTWRPIYFDGIDMRTLPLKDVRFWDMNDHDAMLSTDGVIHDRNGIKRLPTASNRFEIFDALAINNAGHVVGGNSTRDVTLTVPVVYRDGVTTELDSLGGTAALGFDINEAGWIVGYSTTAQSDDMEAFLNIDGQTGNLENLLVAEELGRWEFESATDINDWGQILVEMDFLPHLGYQYAVLTPVPEARGWALMLAGLGMLGMAVMRHRALGGPVRNSVDGMALAITHCCR